MKKNNNSRTLRIVLSILFSIIALVTSFYIIYIYSSTVQLSMSRIAKENMSRSVESISHWITNKEMILQNVERTITTGSINIEDDNFVEYLNQIVESDNSIYNLYFAPSRPPQARGSYVYDGKTNSRKTISDLQGISWLNSSWFVGAKNKGKLNITSPYKDTTTEDKDVMMITISIPIKINSKFEGVLAMDIASEKLKTIVHADSSVKGTHQDILLSNGIYVTNFDERKIFKEFIFNDFPHLEIDKKKFLSGDYYFYSKKQDFITAMGVKNTNWLIVESGDISVYYPRSNVYITLAIVLFILVSIFLLMLFRSWQSQNRLEKAREEIDKYNSELESRIEERTSWLQNILDNTGQGFFTFGKEFLVDPLYSRGCIDILGKDIKDNSVVELLFPSKPDTASDFREGFELLFEGNAKAEIIIDLTEKETILNGKKLAVDYKAISDEKILCILTDITLQSELEEKNLREADRQKKLFSAINNKHSFSKFLTETESLFSVLEMYARKEPDSEQLEELQREIHTFKGNCGFFNLNESQEVAHETETQISDSTIMGDTIHYREITLDLKKAFYKELKVITEIMGERWLDEAGGIMVPHEAYNKILNYLQAKMPTEKKLAHYLLFYKKVPFKELFSKLPFAAQATAERLGKRIKPMNIIGGENRVLPEPFIPFSESLIHLVNNMIDHGIEYPYEREAIQKLPEGMVELFISFSKSYITLEFKDDGKGINVKELEQIALSKSLIEPDKKYSSTELLQLIFKQGFSTKSSVEMTSGRGVGLSAVYTEVKKLDGTIEVQSRLGKGTLFEITIPLKESV